MCHFPYILIALYLVLYWHFNDFETLQGPYKQQDIEDWHDSGFFPLDLPISRTKKDPQYTTLQEMLKVWRGAPSVQSAITASSGNLSNQQSRMQVIVSTDICAEISSLHVLREAARSLHEACLWQSRLYSVIQRAKPYSALHRLGGKLYTIFLLVWDFCELLSGGCWAVCPSIGSKAWGTNSCQPGIGCGRARSGIWPAPHNQWQAGISAATPRQAHESPIHGAASARCFGTFGSP